MAETRRTSAALAVKDVWRLVVAGTWVAGETIVLTVGTRDITVTVGATVTTAAIAQAVVEAWNGDEITGDATRSDTGNNIPEYAGATAAIGSTTSTVDITMNTAGVPLGFSAVDTSAAGSVTVSHPVVATGPEYWTNSDNWSNGVPADGDTFYIDNLDTSIRYDLDQSAIEPAAGYIDQSFTGDIGLPAVNDNGYPEYRDQYLKIGPAVLQIGRGAGNGSGRLKIDTTTDQTALTVFNTGSSVDELPALLWKGTHASNSLVMVNGSVGVAVFGAETATLATITKSGGELTLGPGVTLSGALTQSGGTIEINSLVDGSFTQTGGESVINGTGNVDQLTVRGGTCVLNTTGTLGGATVVSGDGVLDLSQNPVALAGVSAAIDLYGPNAQILDPFKRLGAVAVDFNDSATAAQVNFGANTSYRLTRGNVA